jgi:CheY-like chemotaxis protein
MHLPPPQGILGRKVLVVEDSQPQRALAADLVKGMGAAEVFEAANGVEALAVLKRGHGVDLVFCDLEMPQMDGMR